MVGIAFGGLGILAAIAAFIGAALDRHALDAAWRRVADSRRINREIAQANLDRQDELALWESDLSDRERRFHRRRPGDEGPGTV